MESKAKILIVEDYEFYSQMIKSELENRQYEVYSVKDGNEAILQAKQVTPDLVLLDLIMPIKDGFETLKEFKETQGLQDIKIVVFSNLSQEDDIKKVTEMGAAGYLVKKDFSLKELVDEIEKYIVA